MAQYLGYINRVDHPCAWSAHPIRAKTERVVATKTIREILRRWKSPAKIRIVFPPVFFDRRG
jgi:hypothetical protein